MKKNQISRIPGSDELKRELKREQYKHRYNKTLVSTVYALVTVAAVAVLVATLWMPVLQIYGSSMSPTLDEGDIVISVKTGQLQQGDVVAFYYGNKLLVKRYIAGTGSWVDMDQDGKVYVDNELLDEPYVDALAYGNADITFPYQVPEEKYFLMGDHRSVSVDSRHSVVGCISEEYIVGKIVFRIWPLDQFGWIA